MSENLIARLALKSSDPNTGWLDRQKFAKLVAQECALVVEDSPWNLRPGYKAVDQAALIKKHFGVE